MTTPQPPQLVIQKGVTIPLSALPANSIALDGYVQGPAIDADRRRFSFDHHAGCIRHATLSTCEMTLDAIRVGLDPRGLTIFINDLDADTVLSVWLLLRPHVVHSANVAQHVRAAGRQDALGPAVGEGLVAALQWALAPMFEVGPALRGQSEAEWRQVLDACLGRLDTWAASGAPDEHATMAVERPPPEPLSVRHDGGHWRLVEGAGVAGFAQLYRSGVHAGVVTRPLVDGSWEYTVGKASEFVSGFDVPAILAALRVAEAAANPAQDPAHSWGGGSTIGGSPRNRDGSASALPPDRVAEVVQRVVNRPRPGAAVVDTD